MRTSVFAIVSGLTALGCALYAQPTIGAAAQSAAAMNKGANFVGEAIGLIEQLPPRYPEHWLLAHDGAFTHTLEGRVLVIDPLADNVAEQYKGMMTASFFAGFQTSAKRNEHYVVETFFSRGGRGGDRTDVVTIWDSATLEVVAEIEIPNKRFSSLPQPYSSMLIDNERFLLVFNFTPAPSVSVVDLEARKFIAEIPTPGCSLVLPTGERGFSSLCSNGGLLTTLLTEDGKLSGQSRLAPFNDVEGDPLFEKGVQIGTSLYLPTFSGMMQPINVSTYTPNPDALWSLTSEAERAAGWRPGGSQVLDVDSNDLIYILMHPDGKDGTHKDGGSEVWVFNTKTKTRTNRLVLKNWGISVALTGKGDNSLMAITTPEMSVDIYQVSGGEFLRTLEVAMVTPFAIHNPK